MVECRRKNFYLRIVANNRIVAAEEGKKVEEGKGNILYINLNLPTDVVNISIVHRFDNISNISQIMGYLCT